MLSWDEQVNYICNRVFQCIYQFQSKERLCFNPKEQIRKRFVSTLVLPYFDYASIAFCDVSETLIIRLQRTQNACIRYIFRLRWDDHVTQYYSRLGWLKIKERMEYAKLYTIYKVFMNGEPEYIAEKYNKLADPANFVPHNTVRN
jgi:hypothetical protein